MSEGSFPRPARRFDSVGFSEIVRVRNRVMELLATGQKVWRFEGGEPYMNTPDAVKAGMADALARNQTRYAPSSGIPELRAAILAKVRERNGIPADDESPVVVNGGMHGLFAAFATLLEPGDECLMLSPYWTPIVDLIAYHEAKAVLVPTDEARRDGLATALARHVTPKTKVVYWNNPANPDRRRLLPRRDRGGRRVRARARPRGHLGRGLRGPRLRGRADDVRSHRCPACTSGRSRRTRCRRATR